MKRINVGFNLNKQRQKTDGTFPVRLRITFNRRRKYYTTDIDLTEKGFERITKGERFTKDEREIIRKLDLYKSKALEVAEKLNVFTFEAFEDAFFEKRDVYKSVSYAFDKYIEDLVCQKRIGTAESYGNAKNSLERFKKNLEFADVTPKFLRAYENHMLKKGRSLATIGIYLRSLRTIINNQNIDSSLYPFGKGKGKYTIPTGRNKKKALTMEQIQKIYHYEPEPNTYEAMSRDYWMFLFLSNGMNVKDFCLLKWGDIEGDMITYIREKTKRSTTNPEPIKVSLQPESWEIINRWAIRSLNKDAFIFPHLNHDMNAETQRNTYKQLTRVINDNMKRIARKLELGEDVTTYYARHSFATILKNTGAGVEMISELLGHSNTNVTQSYLDSFEDEQIKEQTKVLTLGLKKAK